MFEELFLEGGLSLERLYALIQLGEEGSLIRAAKGDTGLQSRYSHHLKELSKYFGVELTERVGKSIRLTANGETLVRMARDHFQNLLRFKNEIKQSPPAFRLGTSDSLLQWLVVPTVAALRRPKENVRFILRNLRTEEILSRLGDQRLDFGLITDNPSHSGLNSTSVCRIRHMIVVPDQIGVRRGMLTLKQALLDCPHAVLTADSIMHQSIVKIADGLGGNFLPALECDSISQCVAAVRTGHFASVLPLWSWDEDSTVPHSICEDPKLEELDRDLRLIWHPRLVATRGASARDMTAALATQLADVAGANNETG